MIRVCGQVCRSCVGWCIGGEDCREEFFQLAGAPSFCHRWGHCVPFVKWDVGFVVVGTIRSDEC